MLWGLYRTDFPRLVFKLLTLMNIFISGTCEVFDLKTCSETEVLIKRFIDPCSCNYYYQCSNEYTLNRNQCSPGTAWDHEINTCLHEREVVLRQNCNEDTNVWTRCNTTGNHCILLHVLLLTILM